jgi:glycerate kinase
MKIVIAPNAFKESLTAPEAASWIARGVKKALPRARTVLVPMADGGAATARTLAASTGGRLVYKRVTGPLGGTVRAHFGMLGDGKTAVIEMAEASGLGLVPPGKRNPLITTTYGTGQLIEAALRKGARKIIIGIGDSATVDGGAGMAQALGIRLLDGAGKEIRRGGGNLDKLARIDTTHKCTLLAKASIIVACDVDNPLTGPHGAARVYGPQKGATPAMVKLLEKNLRHLARIIKRDLHKDIRTVPGAGAAGGLGGGLMAFLNARLSSGVKIVAEVCRLREKIKGASLVITGEGRLDGQTARGKTPFGVACIAHELGVPVIAINGSLGDDAYTLNRRGLDAVFGIAPRSMPIKEMIENGGPLLARSAEQLTRLFAAGARNRRMKRRGAGR